MGTVLKGQTLKNKILSAYAKLIIRKIPHITAQAIGCLPVRSNFNLLAKVDLGFLTDVTNRVDGTYYQFFDGEKKL